MSDHGVKKTIRHRLCPAFGAVFLFVLAGCSTFRESFLDLRVFPSSDTEVSWISLGRGVEYGKFFSRRPPVAAYALRLDLASGGFEFVVTPGNGEGALDTFSSRTVSFVERLGLAAGVNASPFRPSSIEEGEPLDVAGLHVAEGVLVSPPENGHAAAFFYADGRVGFRSPPFDLSGVLHALGGFRIILRGGENLGFQTDRHPRTAFGLGASGRFFYVLVADGRNRGHSIGLTTWELAEWLRFLGAFEGINMDGGGSSTLVIRDSGGAPLVVNRPRSSLGLPADRAVANHLGIRLK
jgi:hypothetical protein